MNSPEILQAALAAVDQAACDGSISATAVENIRAWLTEPRYGKYREELICHITDGKWQALDDAFWTIIPFGTGGRRGRMYPIGSNAINDRTIGESAQGLANYVRHYTNRTSGLSCAIAYDTRHRSRHFTELCAGIMVAAGFKVYLLDDYRATPQLSFAVRHKQCDCGIMVTASHNPPSDNAVKVYWSSGAQVLPPHDQAIIDRVMSCQEIIAVPFAEALADGRVEVVTDEIDQAYFEAASACAFEGPRDARILYTPLHGVGSAAVVPLLKRDGFQQVVIYEPHREPSGDFPNVPGHVSNPENKAVFDEPIKMAQEQNFDLILATDPDCDRIGCAAPIGMDRSGPWTTFTGNEIGSILTEFVLSQRSKEGTLSADHYIVKTLVTTELTRRIAESYGVRCEGDLLVGFKHIASVIDREGPDHFVFGTEESHGYLVGQYCRDKDGAVASMLMSELAADLKQKNQSMHQYLGQLYQKHGCHREELINLVMEGSEGMAAIKRLMQAFRDNPPESLAGIPVSQIRDYQANTVTDTKTDAQSTLVGPTGNLVIMDLEQEGNYVAVRPSGTEPKIKLYVFTRLTPAESKPLEKASEVLGLRMQELERDVREYAARNA
jgi:phosphoglucomutase/phosphomannomutase